MDPEEKPPRKLVLMRGLPGSGKSTLASKIAGEQGVVYSTDDFFIVNGKYEYDPKMIGENHQRNLNRTIESMQKGLPLIVIDNTNIKRWQMKKYVEAADKFGYKVELQESQTEWAWKPKQCAKKNNHGVPEDKIYMMKDNFEPVACLDEIREAKEPHRGGSRRPKKH